jgi:hypothetical protein
LTVVTNVAHSADEGTAGSNHEPATDTPERA